MVGTALAPTRIATFDRPGGLPNTGGKTAGAASFLTEVENAETPVTGQEAGPTVIPTPRRVLAAGWAPGGGFSATPARTCSSAAPSRHSRAAATTRLSHTTPRSALAIAPGTASFDSGLSVNMIRLPSVYRARLRPSNPECKPGFQSVRRRPRARRHSPVIPVRSPIIPNPAGRPARTLGMWSHSPVARIRRLIPPIAVSSAIRTLPEARLLTSKRYNTDSLDVSISAPDSEELLA